jgi:hypothetical protein
MCVCAHTQHVEDIVQRQTVSVAARAPPTSEQVFRTLQRQYVVCSACVIAL